MKVAIVGGGWTGLTAGVELVDKGHNVVIFEKEEKVGGFARGFKEKNWKYELEEYYHHIFTSDQEIIDIGKRVGLEAKFFLPETDCFSQGKFRRLDSPVSVLKFEDLSLLSRLRMGVGLGILKLLPNGQFLESMTVEKTLPRLIGNEAYEKIWRRLLGAKFGKYIDQVNLAWFWARVAKRSAALGYFPGGFQVLAEKTRQYIESRGGEVKLRSQIKKIERRSGKFLVAGEVFDRVIVTTPAKIAEKIIGEAAVHWPKIDYLWGQTLVMELSESMLPVYWVNILEKNWPFLVAVEHTKMIDKKYYGGKHIVYFGNYLEDADTRLKMDDRQLLSLFLPYLKKMSSDFKKSWIKRFWRFQETFAQPVFPVNYSKMLPKIETKIKGLFIANMSMVYPFDRGTNYAVFLGKRVAEMVMK